MKPAAQNEVLELFFIKIYQKSAVILIIHKVKQYLEDCFFVLSICFLSERLSNLVAELRLSHCITRFGSLL